MNACSSSEQDKIQVTVVFLTYTFSGTTAVFPLAEQPGMRAQPALQSRAKKLMIGID